MHRLSPRCGGKCRPFSISHKRRHTVQTAFCDVPKSHPRPLPMLFLVPKSTIHRVTAPLFPQKHAPRRMTAFLSRKEGTIHRVTAPPFPQKHTPRRMTASLFPQKHAPRRMTAFLSKKESTIHRVIASSLFSEARSSTHDSFSQQKGGYDSPHDSLFFLPKMLSPSSFYISSKNIVQSKP